MRLIAIGLLLSLGVACGGSEKPETLPTDQQTLYTRLGGQESIKLVVDTFVANVAADTRINKFFAHSDIGQLKEHLVNQICEATGGPCKYTGRTMKESHAGMGVTDADFDALVEDLKKALDTYNVGQKEQDELLGALGGMRADIVEKK